MKLEGKVAIVTGGAHGLGEAYINAYAKEGAKVVIADIDLEGARALERSVKDAGGQALAVKTDVANVEDTLNLAKKAVEAFGKIDILVNNASTVSRGGNLLRGTPFYELSLDAWNRLMGINVNGPFYCARAVFPSMKAQGKGKIINVTSAQFYNGGGSVRYIHYLTSKGAIVGLTRSLARELGDFNINVNCIAPGSTLSEDPNDPEAVKARQKAIAERCIKRVEYPSDLTGLAVFLASSDSDFISGQTIVVDGGAIFS
jgi:3-oxoacyl-[acyl-carrier protein] reductase